MKNRFSISRIARKVNIFTLLTYAVLIFYVVILVVQLAWGFISSFKDTWDFYDNPLSLPQEWMFSNYFDALKAFSYRIEYGGGFKTITFFDMAANTVLYALGSAFMSTIMPCLTAYVVTKFKFKILKVYYVIVIVAMALPIVGNLPAELKMATDLGLYDNIWGIWLMKGYFLGMYFLIFNAAFMTIPDSFIEAAKIDGAGNFLVLFKIMLPLVKTTFFTILLIKFIEFWNDFQTPLLFFPNKPTLSTGLYYFTFSTEYDLSTPPMQLTGSMLVFLPVFILFVFFHKRLMGNLTLGGIKE